MTDSLALFRPLAAALLLSLLVACAAVEQIPTTISSLDVSDDRALVMTGESVIALDTGYSRTVKAGSQWLEAGTIAQGAVFRPHRDVFTLEGAHIHEAYLVLDHDTLVGFYLPAERSFSPLKQKIKLPLQKGRP